MDALERAFGALRIGTVRNANETHTLNKAIKELLDRDTSNVDHERVQLFCDQVFEGKQDDELVLLAWQLLYKHRLKRDCEEDNVAMIVGRLRAKVIYSEFGTVEECTSACHRLLECSNLCRANRILLATILETATTILAKQAVVVDFVSLVRICTDALWQNDELVLQKSLPLTISLLSKLSVGELRSELIMTVKDMDETRKIKYTLLQQLLDHDIQVEDLTDKLYLSNLVGILVSNNAVAPSVADCIVSLLKKNEHFDIDAFTKLCHGNLSLLGSQFFPRLVRSLPEKALLLLSNFSFTDEMGCWLYCCLYSAFLASEYPFNVAVELNAVETLLGSSIDAQRVMAFACLCRSVSMNSVINGKVFLLVNRYLMDLMLDGLSESRQQAISALKYLITALSGRLYQLYKRNNCGAEAGGIGDFLKNIIALCMKNLTSGGYFNKNELSLSILICLIKIWMEKTDKIVSQELKLIMRDALVEDIASDLLDNKAFMESFEACLLNHTFDSLRKNACELLKLTRSLKGIRFTLDEWQLVFKERIFARFATHKSHIFDGAARYTALVCSEFDDCGWTCNFLVNELTCRIDNLDPDSPITLTDCHILAIMACLCALKLSPDNAVKICKLCQRLCFIVMKFVAHPSPEGHSVFATEAADNEDCEEEDDDISISVMTFCWWAIRSSGSLLLVALKSLPLARDLLEENGKFIISIIMKIRHPGAFVALSHPLRDLCSLCYKSRNDLLQLPRCLLDEALEICANQPPVQTTRRSAGLPFCIASIVSSCHDPIERHSMLEKSMKLDEDGLDVAEPDPSVIHNLNILRQLFRDASLAADLPPFNPRAFNVVSKALVSPCWAVRNSGMMLFTALLNRTFGVRHDAEDYSLVNCVDPRTIHAKYGTLFQISEDFANFAILQRYRYSTGGEQAHGEFYRQAAGFALSKLKSRRMKERKMTVRLLVHMWESLLIRRMILEEISEIGLAKEANRVHGLLLLVRALESSGLLGKVNEYTDQVKGFGHCYPIRALLEEPCGDEPNSSGIPLDVAITMLGERKVDPDKLTLIMNEIIGKLSSLSSDQQMQVYSIFESFWTGECYDLEGRFRSALLQCWQPTTLGSSAVRIWYLALTDDCHDIRSMACTKFGTRGSVSFLLRTLLKDHGDVLVDLIDFSPTIAVNEYRACNNERRAAMFEREPLNCFKDPQWEKMILNQNDRAHVKQ